MGFKQNNKGKKKQNMPTLDLHGYTQDSAYDAMDKFIHKHNQNNTPSVKIMSGKGTGVIRKEVIGYLKMAGYSWHLETMPNGKKNDGVFIVPLD